MKLNARELGFLRAIARKPCSLHSFTNDSTSLAPHTISTYLDRQVKAGLIEAPIKQNGAFHITAEGRAFLAALPAPAPSVSYGNGSTSGPYKGEGWMPIRAGSEAFLAIPSKGFST